MIIYDSAAIYIESKTDLLAKITAIDNIINALTTAMLTVASNGGITEYSLDDGQTKINQGYRNPQDVSRSIMAFEGIKNIYVNKLNGRRMTMVDGHNLNRWNNGCY
jgi:hypothetical protein